MPSTRDSWTWYGLVVLFALSPLCVLLSRLSLRGFVTSSGGEAVTPLTALALFALTTLASWASILFGLGLAIALYLDSHRLGGTAADWQPTRLYALTGLVHAAGALVFPFALSVPVVGYYLVRRRRTLSAA
ncbi:hypothetical protein [Haloarcula amylovorans]|uniref:hypothetical protein n=1 Tax=Haloarcula amylovorans TaxID=2562280 RepID=UPI001075ED1C|nr:hypothetical protein [Halomicroarcula amylolytica]